MLTCFIFTHSSCENQRKITIFCITTKQEKNRPIENSKEERKSILELLTYYINSNKPY